jgi:NADH-quinone oxidoreductase subunit C
MDNFEEFIDAMKDNIGRQIIKKRRIYFDVENDKLRTVVDHLFNKMGCRLSTATATEVYKGIAVLYHFSDDKTGCYYCPRILMTDRKNPHMNSITPIVKGAEWIEREMFDLWGIDFEGHPRKEKLLTGNHPEGLKQPLRFRRLS